MKEISKTINTINTAKEREKEGRKGNKLKDIEAKNNEWGAYGK
jgi:hypothetical protein